MDFRWGARVVAGLLAAQIAAPAWSASPSLTLEQATRQALDRAPLLEARDAQVEAAQAEARRAGSLPDPILMVGIDNLPVTGSDAFDVAADEMTMKRVGLRQDFPAGAKRRSERELAARDVDVARADALSERRTVQRQAADAWIGLWAANHSMHALEELRDQARLATRLARAQAGASGGSAAEALAAEAAALETDNELIEVQAQRSAAVAELSRWVPAVTEDVLTPEFDFTVLPASDAQLRARIETSPPLLATNARVERAAAAVSVARADARADWSLAAYYGQRAGGRSDMIGLEVEVALPWLSRRRVGLGVQARDEEYRVVVATRESERRAWRAGLDAELARWHGLQRQVALHESALLPLAHDRTVAAWASYRGGGALQPWLEARRAEVEVHLSHAQHLEELGRAWAALAFLLPEENVP